MNPEELVRASKFLSRVLRHRPEEANVTLDAEGWVEVDALLKGCRAAGRPLTRAELEEIVARNDKRRYAFSEDGRRIRAQQGHTVEVDLNLPVRTPPEVLYHGTAKHSLPAILNEGLRPMGRHYVHLSPDEETARRVGARHGRPVVLTVDSARMHADGHEFRISGNGVWLVAGVPPHYLDGRWIPKRSTKRRAAR
ncbi:RNA 2'-phosphotransferase [Thermobifida cellulosilytica]|uniref:Probable RNA 2'-phosphotransferase n=1 Tax=Thermobifida cellulosilytica TB100 TaxID=665004 RepID=A0A147KK68_THECS|nr:RNA 2'-phosphotransferase [Thermobifida cellulosilytica]KUP97686.1 RNA 2'-phosphotransferase [Thermobifida cellulosilytica TB100]